MEEGENGQMLEEDDVVAKRVVKKDPTTGESKLSVRLGIVSELYQASGSESSSSEEDSDSENGDLKEGEALVEWYPSGKESRVEEEKLLILDRSLMLGELVSKVSSDWKRIGMTVEVGVEADFLLLPPHPTQPTVLRSKKVDGSLAFANPFDSSNSSSYLLYKGWIGALTEVKEKLLLRTGSVLHCPHHHPSDFDQLVGHRKRGALLARSRRGG